MEAKKVIRIKKLDALADFNARREAQIEANKSLPKSKKVKVPPPRPRERKPQPPIERPSKNDLKREAIAKLRAEGKQFYSFLFTKTLIDEFCIVANVSDENRLTTVLEHLIQDELYKIST